LAVHAELTHVEPPGQTRHDDPHALLSLVVSTHDPLQQRPPLHEVPLPALVTFAHTCCPVLQENIPFWHTFPPGWQMPPAEHGMQLPLSQT
jgi:hypothetical protein